MRRALLLLTVLLGLAAAPPAGAQDGLLDGAAQALRSDPVYVHPDAEAQLSEEQAEELRDRIAADDAGPMYVAILPARGAREAGGDVEAALTELNRRTGRPGTYVLVAGRRFRAGSTDLREGVTAEAADQALEAQRDAGVHAILLDFANRMGDVRAGRESGGDGGDGLGTTGLVILGGLALAGGTAVVATRRRRRRVEAEEFAEVRENVQEDLLALGDDIRALDLDVQMPGASEEAKADYERALGSYERASRDFDRARRPADLEPVGAAVEEGRYAMAAARARLEGREPPERRPPCFFDPRHGPSSRDVEWSPPFGEPRMVPACEADAQRVERGEDPEAREVMVGGQRVPYWNAGPAYAPYAGGFFGGGLLPGLFLGSLLGGGWGFGSFESGQSAGDSGGGWGDFGGGGDGGGDFGGGDFGGGDF